MPADPDFTPDSQPSISLRDSLSRRQLGVPGALPFPPRQPCIRVRVCICRTAHHKKVRRASLVQPPANNDAFPSPLPTTSLVASPSGRQCVSACTRERAVIASAPSSVKQASTVLSERAVAPCLRAAPFFLLWLSVAFRIDGTLFAWLRLATTLHALTLASHSSHLHRLLVLGCLGA